MENTAKLMSSGRARIQEASERTHDYVNRAAQSAASGVDKVADTVHRRVDFAADSAKAGLGWATERASTLRERNAALIGALTESVSARPLLTIGIAAAVGYALGRIMQSRD